MDHWTGSARALSGTRDRSCGSEVRPESGSLLWAVQVSHTEWGADVCDRGSVGADPGEVSYCRSTSSAPSGRPRDRTAHPPTVKIRAESTRPNVETTQGLWHVTGACNSALVGHSPTQSLYYGEDGDCDYDVGNSEGAVTSPAMVVMDTAQLTFQYLLVT